MKVTNNFDLPSEYVTLAESDDHVSGGSDFSVTTLIDAPQVYYLRKKFEDAYESDVSDQIAAMIGTGIHRVFEDAASKVKDRVVEGRFTTEVNGKIISCRIDKIIINESGSVSVRDLKVMRANSLRFVEPGGKISWVNQLNMYAAILRRSGFLIEDLAVEAIVKDWSRSMIQYNSSYPRSPVQIIPVSKWDSKVAEEYLIERVRLHCEETPAPCTPEEMWESGSKHALHEVVSGKIKKRATRVFDSSIDAHSYAAESTKRFEVIDRPGKRTRCEENYCGVAKVCGQFAEYRASDNYGDS